MMIRLLLFCAQLLLLVALAVWASDHAGPFTLAWGDQELAGSGMVPVVLALFLLLLGWTFGRLGGRLLGFRRSFSLSHRLRAQRYGERQLHKAAGALATGKRRRAAKLAKEAERVLGPNATASLIRDQANSPETSRRAAAAELPRGSFVP